jgi:hypothetical protein
MRNLVVLASRFRVSAVTGMLVAALSGCGDSSDDPPPVDPPPVDPPPSNAIDVPAGDITVNTTWLASKTYTLKGQVFVTGGTLTIEAGTVIKGDSGSVLVISKTGKLNAVGTAAKPIVFTSSAVAPLAPKSGDWGGVVMLGDAPINVTGGKNLIEGFPASVGTKIEYGGPTAAHDCGKLKYARIEYAGFKFGLMNELNGLTLGGCGTATEIDYVQSHLGLDDGIEIFGGTVNVSHLVITQADDDGLDWDLGWNGKAQFVIVQQKSGLGDRAVEADSNNSDNEATPRSAPELWNLTLIGGDSPATKLQGGLHLRRGTAAKISNAVISYFNQYPVDIDGASSTTQWTASTMTIKNTYFMKSTAADLWILNFDKALVAGVLTENDCIAGVCLDEQAVLTADLTNKIGVDPLLGDAKNLTAPNWKPNAGSPVLTGCGTPGAGFDTTATFCGAIGATDWTTGWTAYPN